LSEIKAVTSEKTEKLLTYGLTVIVVGILLSVFQQAIGINAVLYYAPRIFEKIGGGGDGMMQTVVMGVVNILFTLIAIFTVEKMGRKPLLIVGSIGMAVGAFCVAFCDEFQEPKTIKCQIMQPEPLLNQTYISNHRKQALHPAYHL
jgi:MFS transporter, SP family, xylose:H+ symportor